MKAEKRTMYLVHGTRDEFFELFAKLPDHDQNMYRKRFKDIICADPFFSPIAFKAEEWKYIMGLTGTGTLMTEGVSE